MAILERLERQGVSATRLTADSRRVKPGDVFVAFPGKQVDGRFRKVFEHPEVSEFYHVVVGTTLAGVPVFIGGCRRGKQQLFCVRAAEAAPLAFQVEIIEEGVGPSNVYVRHEPGRDIIVAANREKAEAALYFVS